MCRKATLIQEIRRLEAQLGFEPLTLSDVDIKEYHDWLLEGVQPISKEQAWNKA